ncbi:arsenical-resistance protein Acr3 [Dichotomopilus funicola]|uniref:Arsenical-resistance protein Acr3 n=1 Tax=Dichotomopilus funicola TaxID=1934379 RepID=A0AAN6V603_9PEZI|nr:arsenical-resistance protein Acr3 [Dichotomopilus funicola]
MASSNPPSSQPETEKRFNPTETTPNNNSSKTPNHDDPEKTQPEHTPPEASCCEPRPASLSAFSSLGFLDRYLAVWIFLAMLIGILLGNFVDGVGPALQKGTFVGVSLPIAIGLLVMMYPILCKVQYERLHEVFRTKEIWIQLGFSIVINWIVAPLFMLGLAWAFLPDQQDLREGLILVGIARCIAMVLIWNSLAGGNGDYCAILVAINSLLQIILFAPLSLLFIRVFNPHPPPSSTTSSASITYPTVATSVAVFLGIPLAAAILTRLTLLPLLGRGTDKDKKRYHTHFIPFISPLSLIGLLFTILVLFASQGRRVVHQVVSVVRVAAPLVVYFAVVFCVTMVLARRLGWRYGYAVTQGFTAASNNFELAIAVAVAAYGPQSDQALAATVGPLIEVPVLLGLVYGVRWFVKWKGWGDEEGGREEVV